MGDVQSIAASTLVVHVSGKELAAMLRTRIDQLDKERSLNAAQMDDLPLVLGHVPGAPDMNKQFQEHAKRRNMGVSLRHEHECHWLMALAALVEREAAKLFPLSLGDLSMLGLLPQNFGIPTVI